MADFDRFEQIAMNWLQQPLKRHFSPPMIHPLQSKIHSLRDQLLQNTIELSDQDISSILKEVSLYQNLMGQITEYHSTDIQNHIHQ
jgi:hypothetical protein